jgi:hypothetical protein
VQLLQRQQNKPNAHPRENTHSILANGMPFSFSFVAASSYSGANALQCPHHGA